MSIFGYILPGSKRISRVKEVDKIGLYRLAIVEFYLRNNKKGRLTAQTFGVSTATVYRWVKRYERWNLYSLRDKSRRPIHLRKQTIDWKLIEKVVEVRKENPYWSKYKIGYLLRKKGLNISDSTIGRILNRRNLISTHFKKRKTKKVSLARERADRSLWTKNPGSLVQIDTAYLNPKGRGFCFQYVAIDSKTRMMFSKIYPTRGSKNGKLFFSELIKSFPFKIESIQSDNGSEFLGELHDELDKNSINHYFTYPATPKMNSRVERVIKTTREEFWNDGNMLGDLDDLNESLKEWIIKYNTKRPHESLGYLTPLEYYQSIEKEATGFR
jgi:transposase InsO family protein